MKINLKKGLNLDLAGAIEATAPVQAPKPALLAIVPDDFWGFTPKLEVREGDQVLAGQPLLRDKNRPQVKLVAPVAGTVQAVVRGERRKIERVVIEAGAPGAVRFDVDGAKSADKALELLCMSGMLARMRQRPYDVVPNPDVAPRDIFVTAIDSAPLAPGFEPYIAGKKAEIAAATALLKLLTKGNVYISVPQAWSLGDIPGAAMVEVCGKHPAGNVGVQIANIAPINKGEVVWTLDIVTLAKIGTLLLTGQVDSSTLVALTGSEVEHPCLLATTEGAAISSIVDGRLAKSDHHVRIISGNVLTGTAVSADGFLRFPYRQITVIPDGDDTVEFMGWASMSPSKMSTSPSFLSHFFGKKFRPDARINGGQRAMIMSGQLDKYMPMDIMPEFLLKAIIARDIEQMERLGIYEVAPEDFALAEFADTSKQPLQQMVRDGLDYLRKELE